MASHTPGHWKIADQSDFIEGRYHIEDENGDALICYGASFYEEPNPGRANARLIAAAPDLLAACKALLAEHANQDPRTETHAQAAAKRAIAKATGAVRP